MEIDLTELDLYEKQLAERRRLRQQKQSTQIDSSCDSSVATTTATAAVSSSTSSSSKTSQNVDEIDAYLDRLALDLQAKDEQTNEARGTNRQHQIHSVTFNAVSSGSQCQPLMNSENSNQNNDDDDDCDKNGHAVIGADATAVAAVDAGPSNSKTTLPLLIYAFLSILAYVNTVRCKIYTRFNL